MERLRTLEVNPNAALNSIIERYFDAEIGFLWSSRMDDFGFHYFNEDLSRGFFFAVDNDSNGDYVNRMRSSKDFFSETKLILREFVDYEAKVAGFSWRNR